jgi:hypothetical protein
MAGVMANQPKKLKRHVCPKVFTKNGKSAKADPCWRVEKSERFKREGFITAFYDRSSGRLIGYSKGYLSPGRTLQQICGASRDPFRAVVKNKSTSSLVGELCIRFAKAAQKPKKKGSGK